MISYNKILNLLFLITLAHSQEWLMTINAQDINQTGASDYIILGMCNECHDGFHFAEDEYDLPAPPSNYTDISFFNYDWVGNFDENGNQCNNPEFYIDKKDFHSPADLLKWNISGFTNLSNDDNIELSWTMEDLSNEYEIFIYIDTVGYNMRNQNNIIIAQDELLVSYNPETDLYSSNIEVLIGGCANEGTTTYYYDADGDGYGANTENPQDFCPGFEPDGWVANDIDVNDNFYCEENIIDLCNICNGTNQCLDCNNDPFGSAEIDDCGICSGGNTNHIANSDMDCSGTCYGNAEIDDCGICDGFNQSCLNEIFLNGPDNVYAYINENTIELRWDQLNYPDNHAILGFNIYRNDIYLLSTTEEEYILNEFNDGEFCVSAFDQYSNESQLNCATATNLQEFCWILDHGLNLISYPILPIDISLENIFSSIDEHIVGVISQGDAASILPNGTWIGSLTQIENYRGYWVKLDLGDPFATQEYCVIGYPVLETLPYELSTGANLISYLGNNEDLIINAVGQYDQNFEAIIGAASAAYNSPISSWVGSLTNLKQGEGYWVIVNENFIFHWIDE